MNPIILFAAVLIVLALATTFLCADMYREEDRRRRYEASFQIINTTRPCIYITWSIVAIYLTITIFCELYALKVIGLVFSLFSLFLLLVALYHRGDYYVDDQESLTYIRHRAVAWSIRWDEIAHVYRRIVSTGKTFVIFYDIETTDGRLYKSQPSMLGSVLKRHKCIERYPTNWKLLGYISLALIVIILIAILILKSR